MERTSIGPHTMMMMMIRKVLRQLLWAREYPKIIANIYLDVYYFSRTITYPLRCDNVDSLSILGIYCVFSQNVRAAYLYNL